MPAKNNCMNERELYEEGVMVTNRLKIPKKVAIINDLHIPFHDRKTLNHVIKFLQFYKPRGVILNGDIIDFYSISYFEKDPRLRMSLRRELKETYDVLNKLVSKVDADFYYIRGNHEDRLTKYILSKANELAWLPALELYRVLQLPKLGIKYVNSRYAILNRDILVSHLDKFSRYGAARLVGRQYPGFHVVHGHTHVVYYMQYYDRVYIDNGCLSQLTPTYMNGPSFWAQSLTVVEKGLPRLVLIRNHKVIYGNDEF